MAPNITPRPKLSVKNSCFNIPSEEKLRMIPTTATITTTTTATINMHGINFGVWMRVILHYRIFTGPALHFIAL